MFGCRCCCYRHHITSCSPPNAYKPSIILNIKCISDSRIIPNCLLWTIARELEPSEDISTNVCVYNTTQYKIECWNNFIKWNQKQWVSVRTRVPGPPTTDISNATNVTIKEVIKENMYAQAYITSFVEWESERERKKKTHVNCRGHSPYPISIWIKYNIGNCCNCFSHMRIRTHYNANIYIGPGRPFGRSVRLYADYKMYKHVQCMCCGHNEKKRLLYILNGNWQTADLLKNYPAMFSVVHSTINGGHLLSNMQFVFVCLFFGRSSVKSGGGGDSNNNSHRWHLFLIKIPITDYGRDHSILVCWPFSSVVVVNAARINFSNSTVSEFFTNDKHALNARNHK